MTPSKAALAMAERIVPWKPLTALHREMIEESRDKIAAAIDADPGVRGLVEALRLLLEDPRFSIAIGGNPNTVKKLMKQCRAALRDWQAKP